MLMAEVEVDVHYLRNNGAPGQDGIDIEEMTAFGELVIAAMEELLTDLYGSGYIPDELLRFVFMALPKRPCPVDCKDHRTIR